MMPKLIASRPNKFRLGRGTLTLLSRSPEETERFGRRLASSVPVPGVVLLFGSLGAGKTTLTRGIAAGLGVCDPAAVHSPSFTIVNVYQGTCSVYHVDLYRLTEKHSLRSVGIEDFIGRDGVTIVEWGERLGQYTGKALVVEIEDAGGEKRIIRARFS